MILQSTYVATLKFRKYFVIQSKKSSICQTRICFRLCGIILRWNIEFLFIRVVVASCRAFIIFNWFSVFSFISVTLWKIQTKTGKMRWTVLFSFVNDSLDHDCNAVFRNNHIKYLPNTQIHSKCILTMSYTSNNFEPRIGLFFSSFSFGSVSATESKILHQSSVNQDFS